MSTDVADRLREAREARGLSAADVAAQMRVPVAYIEALDSGNIAALPEATFVRGYARAYAKLVGIDATEVVALLAPVEVKAPRQQVGISGISTKAPRRGGGRSGFSLPRPGRHHYVAAAVVLAIAAGWVTWTGREPAPDATVVAPAAEMPLPVPVAPAVGDGQSMNGLSMEVPLPGATTPATAPATAGAGSAPAALLGAPTTAGAAPAAGTLPAATPPPAAVNTPAGAVSPAAAPAASVPREGLVARFHGDCWIEVRDADNMVIHKSSAKGGTELRVNGKEPLTVTLGAAERVNLWWNGDPVAVDSFSRAGVARVNVGRIAR